MADTHNNHEVAREQPPEAKKARVENEDETAPNKLEHPREREMCIIRQYGTIERDSAFPLEWPSGEKLIGMLQEQKGIDNVCDDPVYWQTSVRWALLAKYNKLPDAKQRDPYIRTDKGVRQLSFDPQDVKAIQTAWKQLCDDASSGHDELSEFFKTSLSSGRTLQWSVMDVEPGHQFRLHAHPNIEIVFVVKGALFEVRMSGEPFYRDFSTGNNIKGPNLSQLDRSWFFDSVQQGEWLVNEIGSIHKSFTGATCGCILMCLWGGSHANIVEGEEPQRVNVDDAVNTMADKLTKCDCTRWEKISETFLPESERSST